MVQQIDPAVKNALLSADFRAAVTLWNRLEGRPRKEDFDRSLRAEVRDPLWMLTRQWQFGEFKGEDAGSAVKARVQLNTTKIDRYAVKSEIRDQFENAVPYDQSFPLEIEVEREPVLPDGPEPNTTNLVLRSRMGRHWMRLLKQAGVGEPNVRVAILERFGFEDISERDPVNPQEQLEEAHLKSDPLAWQTLKAVKGRLPDGRKLLAAIRDGSFDTWADGEFDVALAQVLKDLGKDFSNWFDRLYSQPQADVEDAWAPSYLEYQFAVSAPEDESGEKRATLVAEQYYHGSLDWFAFDIDNQRQLQDLRRRSFRRTGLKCVCRLVFCLRRSSSAGCRMFVGGSLKIADGFRQHSRRHYGCSAFTARRIGLIYGNDWTVVPYNLEVGSLADIKGIIVTYVFGIQTLIRPAGRGQRMDWQKWSMYNLRSNASVDSVDNRLVLAAFGGESL